jgi:hypothetical protein
MDGVKLILGLDLLRCGARIYKAYRLTSPGMGFRHGVITSSDAQEPQLSSGWRILLLVPNYFNSAN